ncbi:MAG: hypothetical protein MH208_12255 [Marinobacter sp.]|nr:hypothetical protein [Marinobacter sp.]
MGLEEPSATLARDRKAMADVAQEFDGYIHELLETRRQARQERSQGTSPRYVKHPSRRRDIGTSRRLRLLLPLARTAPGAVLAKAESSLNLSVGADIAASAWVFNLASSNNNIRGKHA